MVFSQGALAQWPQSAKDAVTAFNAQKQNPSNPWTTIAQYIGWDDPYFTNVWEFVGTQIYLKINSLTRYYRPNAMPFRDSEVFSINVNHMAFGNPLLKGQVPARILWRKKDGLIQKAPLVLYNPGLFQDAASPSSHYIAESLSNLGFHVLVISNPFSRDYVDNMPLAPVGSYIAEATVLKDALMSFVDSNRRFIENVNVLGVSYGGYLSAILAALDADHKRIIDGSVTLVGPPVDMYRSLEQLDRLIDESQRSFSSRIFERVVGRFIHKGLSQAHHEALVAYLYFKSHGFADRQYSARAQEVYEGLLKQRDDQQKMREWMRSIRFNNSLYNYTPENVEMYRGPLGKLSTWLQRNELMGRTNIRILTACDDFINQCDWWKELTGRWQTDDHLLMRSSGSHNGFLISRWFEEFLATSYGKKAQILIAKQNACNAAFVKESSENPVR